MRLPVLSLHYKIILIYCANHNILRILIWPTLRHLFISKKCILYVITLIKIKSLNFYVELIINKEVLFLDTVIRGISMIKIHY